MAGGIAVLSSAKSRKQAAPVPEPLFTKAVQMWSCAMYTTCVGIKMSVLFSKHSPESPPSATCGLTSQLQNVMNFLCSSLLFFF